MRSLKRCINIYLFAAALFTIVLSDSVVQVSVSAAENPLLRLAKLGKSDFSGVMTPEDRLATQSDPAVGLFLVATPQLIGSRFSKTVILLIDHGMHGSVGIIINRPSETKLSSIFPEVKEFRGTGYRIYFGGPVNFKKITALIRSDVPVTEADHVLDNIYTVSDVASLRNVLISNHSIKDVRVYSGYAGWWAGQLDREIMRGSWNVIEGNAESVFRKDLSRLWQDLQP